MRTSKSFRLFFFLFTMGSTVMAQDAKPIWQNERYRVYSDRVEQDSFTGRAVSATTLTSNYRSPANENKAPLITFKFSINGKDNEMKPGSDHQFVCLAKDNYCETPLIRFGSLYKDTTTIPSGAALLPGTRLRLRVDMRGVLDAFNKDGFYTLYNGEKLYREDFRGVFVAGSTTPMTWDFDNLHNFPKLELKDENRDGIFEADLLMNVAGDQKKTATEWTLSKNIDQYPRYSSPYVISDAIYNMSLEEMLKAVEPDSTFRTGEEWGGVWTRDISYSILLSMAYLQPAVSKYSLMRKVNAKKRIIQDTGTGGAWPVSTDRMVWALAAWEIYKVTGDKAWLEQSYEIVKNSIEDDYHVAYDKETGLVKGESSFLDWREQTYPAWMEPADIFSSKALGTNAVHYQVNMVLNRMAVRLNRHEEAIRYLQTAMKIRNGINRFFWIPSKNYFGQFLYGRHYEQLSPRAEALGEALTILFDMVDVTKQKAIVAHMPQLSFGVPTIYPQIPDIPSYHNNATWPFVQSFWMWAAAKAGNEKAVMESIAAIYRPAALFLTNKENFVADNGDFAGTEINSSNMLWSLAGNISLVHKVFFGIHFNETSLQFKPFVPLAFAGKRTLTAFRYRDAVLNISMEGHGNRIKTFSIDGKVVKDAVIPSTLRGAHDIKIVLAGNIPAHSVARVENDFTLPAPVVSRTASRLWWNAVDGAVLYQVIKNGQRWRETKEAFIDIDTTVYGNYSVMAVDNGKIGSFASEPVLIAPAQQVQLFEMEAAGGKASYNYRGYSGEGFAEVSTRVNRTIRFPLHIDREGVYHLDFRYANGNGPINTENKCAVRTLLINNQKAGVFVFPQRGTGEWSNWGFSNSVRLLLKPGNYVLSLSYLPPNENMNGEINQAMIDYMRVIAEEKPSIK